MRAVKMKKSAAVLAMFAALAGGASADMAVVVGIDVYKNIPEARLRACENDADSFASMLTGYGFSSVKLLKSAEADKESILGALDSAIQALKKGERFVYFQSSHGATQADGTSVLVTGSTDEYGQNSISREEIQARLRAAIAKGAQVTLILDACFSEGITARGDDGKALGKVKYLRLKGSPQGSKDYFLGGPQARVGERVVVANAAPQTFNSGVKVEQYASSRADEPSYCESVGIKPMSYFTKQLVSKLLQKPASWADVMADVNHQVYVMSRDSQHPVYVGSGGGPVFSSAASAAAPPSVSVNGIGGLYGFDNINADKVFLQMLIGGSPAQPDTKIFVKGENETYCRFTARAGSDGFLFVLDRDSKDLVKFMWPESLPADADGILKAAKVSSGVVLGFPVSDEEAFRYDTLGTEHIKAILFTNETEARKFIGLSKEAGLLSGDVSLTELGKNHERVRLALASYYTSDVRFEVVKQGN